MIGGSPGDNGMVLMACLILGFPLANEPCINALGGTRWGIVVKTAGQEHKNSDKRKKKKGAVHGDRKKRKGSNVEA